MQAAGGEPSSPPRLTAARRNHRGSGDLGLHSKSAELAVQGIPGRPGFVRDHQRGAGSIETPNQLADRLGIVADAFVIDGLP
jgi:hypothetical protein